MLRKLLGRAITARTYAKVAVNLDSEVILKLERGELKPRKHPGIRKDSEILMPSRIRRSIIKCVGDFPVKKLLEDGQKLSRYIAARHAPPEQQFIQYKTAQIQAELDEKYPKPANFDDMTDVQKVRYENARRNRFEKMLKQRIFAWQPINYGKYEALVYAAGRSSLEYTVLHSIFNEIRKNDSNFKPRSFFDFGSGVGTAMWAAANFWKDTIFEYYNVDASREMNDLADLILRDGNDNQQSTLNNVYFRQFVPAKETQFDLVTAAFSLFELNSKKSRSELLLNLWKKCSKYLILVEEGTRSGFELITEAREFLLKQGFNQPELTGHLFSPCPHDLACPRSSSSDNKTPCNFEIQYEPYAEGERHSIKKNHLYSYIVLKKGTCSDEFKKYLNWPRIVRPTLVRSKHTICRLCTAGGNLEEVIFTASKHGKLTYQCARSSKWADKLPIMLEKPSEEQTKTD